MKEYRYVVKYRISDESIHKSATIVAGCIEAAANHWTRQYKFPIASITCTGPISQPVTSNGTRQRFHVYSSDKTKSAEIIADDINGAIERYIAAYDTDIASVDHVGPFEDLQPEPEPSSLDIAVDLLVRLHGARLTEYNRERTPKQILAAYDKHTEND